MSKEKELQQNSITAQHQIWKQTNDYQQEKQVMNFILILQLSKITMLVVLE